MILLQFFHRMFLECGSYWWRERCGYSYMRNLQEMSVISLEQIALNSTLYITFTLTFGVSYPTIVYISITLIPQTFPCLSVLMLNRVSPFYGYCHSLDGATSFFQFSSNNLIVTSCWEWNDLDFFKFRAHLVNIYTARHAKNKTALFRPTLYSFYFFMISIISLVRHKEVHDAALRLFFWRTLSIFQLDWIRFDIPPSALLWVIFSADKISTCTGGPKKSKPLSRIIIKLYYKPSVRLDFSSI